METLRSFKKWFTPLFVFLSAMLILGCSKDDDVAPSNGNDSKIIFKTIGSNGGEIALDSFSIAIPPGAFKEDIQLELSVSARQHPFTEEAITSLYQIKGIPDEFSESIKVALKYGRGFEDEGYIAHGWDHQSAGSDTTIIMFGLIDAIESNGYLEGELLPSSQQTMALGESTKLKSSKDEIPAPIIDFFLGISGSIPRTHETPGNTFTLHYPVSLDLDSRLTKLPEYLESNYLIFQSLMHHLAFPTFKPPGKINVFGGNFTSGDKRLGYFYYNLAYFYNITRLHKDAAFNYYIQQGSVNEVELNLLIGKAFFNAFQCFVYDDVISSADWFSNAAGLWMQEKFYEPWGSIDNYVPSKLKGNELVPFNKWGGDKSEFMAPVIKYLVENKEYGINVIIRFHENIEKKKSWYEAMNLSIEDPLETWMPDFFQHYMEGNIYNVSGDIFAAGVEGQYDLSAMGTPQSIPYDDLSAKIYRFNTKDVNISGNAKIIFTLESNVDSKYLALLVFSFDRNNSQIKSISNNYYSTEFENIKELQANSKDLLAVVVNSYKDLADFNNKSSITLEVELGEIKPLTYQRFRFSLEEVNIIETYQDGTVKKFSNTSRQINMPNDILGKFTGEQFDADWNLTELLGKPNGFVKATVMRNSDGYFLSDFEMQYLSGSTEYDFINIAKGENITMKEGSSGDNLYGIVEGSEINNKLTKFAWSVSYYNPDKTLTKDSYVVTFELTENSKMMVQFTWPE